MKDISIHIEKNHHWTIYIEGKAIAEGEAASHEEALEDATNDLRGMGYL